METYQEPSRELRVVSHCDVLVAGGGPAGIAAAIAAADGGARVTILETHGQLGGIWTSGLLAWILDADNKPGVMRLILDRMHELGARSPLNTRGSFSCDPEKLKLLLETLCAERGITIRLHTRVCAAGVTDGRLRVVITESKSGREAWAAKTFIDCTGDGDLGAAAGCGFAVGHPHTGRTQPMSLITLIGGVQYEQIKQYVHETREGKPWRCGTNELLAKLKSIGIEPSYGSPIVMHVYDDLYMVMINHQYNAVGLNADEITQATLAARAELHRIFDGLRASGGEWANVKIVATAPQIGVREGRRLRGLYEMTRDDLIAGATFPDAICRVTFPIDVHSTDPNQSKSFAHPPEKAKPYDIPLRALIAADIDGLLMAGRCISGDFIAHSSYRVTGNAVAMGQAAGACAALAAKRNISPRDVPFSDVSAALQTLNDRLPASTATIPSRSSTASAPRP